MGYLLFESSEKLKEAHPQRALVQLCEAIQEAGTRDDGHTEVEITVRGTNERRLLFQFKNMDELVEILRLNSDTYRA